MAVSYNFAIQAQYKLSSGDGFAAIALLEEGIKAYPEYATAYAVLARAYIQLEDAASARDTVKQGRELFPSNRALILIEEELRSPIYNVNVTAESDPSQKNVTQDVREKNNDELVNATIDDEGQANDEEIIHASSHQSFRNTGAENSTDLIHDTEVIADEDSESNDSVNQAGSSLLGKINVIGGTVVLDRSLLDSYNNQVASQYLRLIETSKIDQQVSRILRSSNLKLIPGLEFTPLRVQSSPKKRKRVAAFLQPPAFPVIRGSGMNTITPLEGGSTSTSTLPKKISLSQSKNQKKSPLEALAQRLEQARIPNTSEQTSAPSLEVKTLKSESSFSLTFVNETMASIYEKQGALEHAIEAYSQLAECKPEKRQYFEEKVAELRKRLSE